jgi:DNA-binding Lrp family transcriptional regulator
MAHRSAGHGGKPKKTAAGLPADDHGVKDLDRAAREQARLADAQGLVASLGSVTQRILSLLSDGPRRPSVLAAELGVAPETVSRQLRQMREDGLVEARGVYGDNRAREYVLLDQSPAGDDDDPEALTVAGAATLSWARAFEPPPPAPEPLSSTETEDYLWSGLRRAVAMRRRANRHEDALARLRLLLEETEEIHADELTVEVLAEIATTLRQLGRDGEATEVLDRLEDLSLSPQASVALPAAAHRAYGLGRVHEREPQRLRANEAHLIAAGDRFAQLARMPVADGRGDWRSRLAWSQISLADNFLRRAMFEDALDTGSWALAQFEDMGDDYGRSHSMFIKGFCFRVLGDYDEAWGSLKGANDVARANAFERFVTTSLMQMGDVRRCQGLLDDARTMLTESMERASSMHLDVTEAFARSAIGALAYQEHHLGKARDALGDAHELFVRSGHAEGIALNTRRRAIVARAVLDEGGRIGASDVMALAVDGLERYEKLRSPAGILACEIERGWLEAATAQQEVVGRLLVRLDTLERDLIELDPWVPSVLNRFAQHLGDATLIDRAKSLVSGAHRRLAKLVHRPDVDRQPTGGPTVDEMGGEACRQDQRGYALARVA